MSNENKFTPGPWRVNAGTVHFHIHDNSRAIARTLGDDTTDQANARLIAAAPEIFNELQILTKLLERHRVRYGLGGMMPEADQQLYIDSARAALAKVGGN
jgi:hypothetical protein